MAWRVGAVGGVNGCVVSVMVSYHNRSRRKRRYGCRRASTLTLGLTAGSSFAPCPTCPEISRVVVDSALWPVVVVFVLWIWAFSVRFPHRDLAFSATGIL